MTRFRPNKVSKSLKINGNYFAVPLEIELTQARINSELDRLNRGKEAIVLEKIGLLEELCVQAVCKGKGISIT